MLDEVDSTMSEAARRAATITAPTWISARRQTAARGRRGRAWANPAGNFAATLLSFPTEPISRVALRSYAAALALRDALVALIGDAAHAALKWPNDVLLDNHKVAGILLESRSASASRPAMLLTGFGVNLAAAPPRDTLEDRAWPPGSVAGLAGVSLTPDILLDHLAPAMAQWESRLMTSGFAPLRAEFLSHAVRRGEQITARTGHRDVTGVFDDIDANGAMVLATPTGPHAVPAADIYF